LGATLKDVPMADVFDSVSKGVIDGVHQSAEPFKTWRLADVCKYITVDPGLPQPSITFYNIMNKAKWNSLPPDIQKTITEVSKEYVGKLGLVWDEQSVLAMEYAKGLGDTIYVLPKDESAKWSAAMQTVIAPRLKSVASRGYSQKEVEDAWKYFQGRVTYWNEQQAKNSVTPVLTRIEKGLK
jgi:TRAP-type C4-dicarboxylate transport system substrate-binding protein